MNYYQILRITKEATLEEIKKAYHKMVLKFHPDKNPNPRAAVRFKKIQEAYEVLTERRDIYDKFAYDEDIDDSDYIADECYDADATLQYRNTSYSYCPTENNRYDPYEKLEEDDLKKNFKQNFNQKTHEKAEFTKEKSENKKDFHDTKEEKHENKNENKNKSDQNQSKDSQNGNVEQDPPIEHDLPITLEEVLKGCTKKMKITRIELSQNMLVSTRKSKILTIDVKPGWKAGTRITFDKEGNQFLGRIPANIVFIIRDKPHSQFIRSGSDISYTYDLTLKEALCGSEIVIPTLAGDPSISMSLQGVTKPNTVRRLQGRGLPNPKRSNERGDLLVTFEVLFPEKIPLAVQRFFENNL